ncbi:hypothetical protein BHE74_00026055 [Ensete ventricosum]|nr:hypothetical protein GW17_00012502 [Ensete ventricosum]RWW66567.1 hypothetical protein BHE74_00026055 [Ensete ventricosum]
MSISDNHGEKTNESSRGFKYPTEARQQERGLDRRTKRREESVLESAAMDRKPNSNLPTVPPPQERERNVERDGTFLATFAVTETTAAAPPAAPSLQSRAHVPAVGDGLTMHGEQVKLQRRGGGDPHAAGEKNQPTSMAFIASSTLVHF